MKLLFIIGVKNNLNGTPSLMLALVIFRGDLLQQFPWLFAVGICCSYLSWLFAVKFAAAICRGFVLCMQTNLFFLCKQAFLIEKRLFYMWAKLFLFMRIFLLTVFLFVIPVAVIGHCTTLQLVLKTISIKRTLMNSHKPYKENFWHLVCQ